MSNPWRALSWALYLGLAALPLLAGWGYATAYSLGLTGLLNEGFTLAHWGAVASDPAVGEALLFSSYVAVVSISLAAGLALWAVIAWQEDLLRGWLSYAVYLPLTIPAIVVGFVFFQLLSRGGLLSRISFQLGWTDGVLDFPDWVNDPFGIGIIVAHAWMALPFFLLLFANLFRSGQLASLGEAARSLGATGRQVAHRVYAPVLLRKAFPTLALYLLFVLGSYDIPLLLGAQTPQMVSVLAIRKLQRFNLMDIPQAYAISAVFVLIVVLFLLTIPRRQTESV